MKKHIIRLLILFTMIGTPSLTLMSCAVSKQVAQITQIVNGKLTDAQTIRGSAIGLLTTLNIIDTLVEKAVTSPVNPIDPYKAKDIVKRTSSLATKVKTFIDQVNPLLEREVSNNLTDLDKLEIDKKSIQYDILKIELNNIVSDSNKLGLNVPTN